MFSSASSSLERQSRQDTFLPKFPECQCNEPDLRCAGEADCHLCPMHPSARQWLPVAVQVVRTSGRGRGTRLCGLVSTPMCSRQDIYIPLSVHWEVSTLLQDAEVAAGQLVTVEGVEGPVFRCGAGHYWLCLAMVFRQPVDARPLLFVKLSLSNLKLEPLHD